MNQEKNRMYTVMALVAVVTLLLSCAVGAVAGGLTGLMVSHRRAQIMVGPTWGGGPAPHFHGRMPRHRCGEPPSFAPGMEGQGVLSPAMPGAFVVEVHEDSPAEEAGLRPGDIITAIDRTPVDGAHPLPDILDRYEPGDRVTVTVWHDDEEQTVVVQLGTNPENRDRAYLGVYYEMIDIPPFGNP